MENLNLLVDQLLALPPAARTPEQVILSKRAFSKIHKFPDLPTNVAILKTYKHMIQE
jgi:hypothetical protein